MSNIIQAVVSRRQFMWNVNSEIIRPKYPPEDCCSSPWTLRQWALTTQLQFEGDRLTIATWPNYLAAAPANHNRIMTLTLTFLYNHLCCSHRQIDKKSMHKAGMVQRVTNEVEIHCRLKHPSILEVTWAHQQYLKLSHLLRIYSWMCFAHWLLTSYCHNQHISFPL